MVVLPGALALCGDASVARKGVVLDKRVCASTAAVLLRPVAAHVARFSAFVAREAQQEKLARYAGHWDAVRYVSVPFFQECFGRLGEAARISSRSWRHIPPRVRAAVRRWCGGGTPSRGELDVLVRSKFITIACPIAARGRAVLGDKRKTADLGGGGGEQYAQEAEQTAQAETAAEIATEKKQQQLAVLSHLRQQVLLFGVVDSTNNSPEDYLNGVLAGVLLLLFRRAAVVLGARVLLLHREPACCCGGRAPVGKRGMLVAFSVRWALAVVGMAASLYGYVELNSQVSNVTVEVAVAFDVEAIN
ncbi:hypothetical protein JKP88DRAFT_254528 [Tribonema minus]|uniref:Uncharacterized protein n=1 Tax=Tribonema minus TaxID=303371 RepID=A0A836CKB3_9STRA|nr:hypothetical protein JKP88DRAFT_254528 [Tribonema minus]